MKGQRVFEHVIGSWPKVYDQGGGCYSLVARHRSPTAENWAGWLAMLAGCWIGWKVYQGAGVAPAWSLIWGAVAGMVTCKVITAVMMNVPVLSSGTRIEFNGGTISWKSASGQGLIREDEPRQVRHAVSREAGAEMRRNAMKSNRRDAVTLYQTTAEVLIDTGPGWMHPHLIAEIANDETREKAHKLAAAIAFVDDVARTERDALEIQMGVTTRK